MGLGALMADTVLTRDLSSGRIHRRVLVNGTYMTSEADNLDDAGAFEVITAEQLADAEPGELCERCFPDIPEDVA
jgi:hypothetical protein